MGTVTFCSTKTRKRDAGRAHAPFVDNVSTIGPEQPHFLRLGRESGNIFGSNSAMITVLMMFKATLSLGLPPPPFRN